MKTKRLFLLASAIFVIILILIFINPEYKTKEINYPGAYEALQFLTHSRAYPADDIPKDKYYQEYLYSKNVLETKSSLNDSSSWETIGPTNIGGRMISVAVNPFNSNTLYAGSASGGLWRTHNATGAADWHRIHTGFPVLGVMAIAISPVDSNTIYIGTGEVYGYQQSVGGTVIRTTRGSYGFGILKTTDGGLNWSLSLDWTNNIERGVQCIRINPQNPNSIYAATTEGIYKSTNAGASWQLVLPVLMGEDIVIHATDTTKIMVSCGNLGSAGSGIYRSLDGGVNWNQLSGIPSYNGKTLLGMFQANPNVIYASVANTPAQIGLFKTTNFGDNWTQVHYQDVCEYQGWFSHWVAVHPTDVNQVIHAGKYIYKSTNGGNIINQVYANHWD
ncbi:WD40/YVTN/BNR-like repeat-containing protein, partial [Calditrichota bacterium]